VQKVSLLFNAASRGGLGAHRSLKQGGGTCSLKQPEKQAALTGGKYLFK